MMKEAPHLPIVHRGLFRHELIDTQPALSNYLSASSGGNGWVDTHVAQHAPVNTHELRELAVPLVYFARPAPKARGNTHGGEHAIVVKQ